MSPISPQNHLEEDLDGAEDAEASIEELIEDQGPTEEVTASDSEVDEARVVKRPHDPGKPTRKELEEHLPLHWPFRSWCRHCVRGRGVASPHKRRSDEDKEFPQGRIPTISLDHCFLGSERSEDSAHANPFLIVYDNETEGVFAISVPSKATKPWVVEYVKSIVYELGYGEMKIALKSDGARELHELRRAIAASRSHPTVPVDVPVKESKGNGGMERAVRTWSGQYRTIKSHLEYELKTEIPLDHQILQWMAWWAAGLLNRVAVRHHGRTTHEFITGHKMKLPVAIFGETLLWRRKRETSELGKHDPEYTEGIFLGMSGTSAEIVLGTPKGIVRARDVRIISDPAVRWNAGFVLRCTTAFEQYIDPSQQIPDKITTEPSPVVTDGLPEMPEVTAKSRRMRLVPQDFQLYGYTGGCPGCIHLRRGGGGQSRNHTQECRDRLEKEIEKTAAGRARKEKETARKEDELTKRLVAEDEKIQKEKEMADRKDAAKANEVTLDDGPQHASESKPEEFRMDQDDVASSTGGEIELEDRVVGRGDTVFPNEFATDRAIPIRRVHSDENHQDAGPSDKKYKSTSEAQRNVDERAPAQARGSSSTGVGADPKRPRVPEPSSPTISYKSDEALDADMTDRQIISSILRGVDVTEVFSPARVVEACRKHGLLKGDSFDLRTGYDLADPKVQRQVMRQIQSTTAQLVICSPPCTKFSRLQALNLYLNDDAWRKEFEKDLEKPIKHIDFCLEVMRLQQRRGRYFLFEHPAYADSWQLPQMKEFVDSPGVATIVGDMCMYGLVTPNSDRTGFLPAKKPTQFMSNSWYVLKELGIRCDKSHEHQHLMGGRASKAAEYAFGLCDAICRGMARQKAYDRTGKVCSGALDRLQLQSVISSVKRWQEEDFNDDPIGSDLVSPPVTDEAGGGQLDDQHVQGQTAHQPKPAVTSSEGEFVDVHNLPPHWKDDKHELDGTAFEHLAVSEEVLKKDPIDPSAIVRGPIQFYRWGKYWSHDPG